MAWSSILTVFVFAILAVSSVGSFQCTVCQDLCTTTATCDTTKYCYSQLQRFETPSTVTDKILKPKGCGDTCSDLEFSATLGAQRTFRYVNRCCQTEKCNQDDIKETTPSLKANGLQCTACYNEKDKSCSATTTLMCTGEEKMCVEVTGTDTQTSNLVLYGKGCATESACKQDLTVNGNVQIKTTCSSPVATDGSPALKSITSLPIALLLLKVLL